MDPSLTIEGVMEPSRSISSEMEGSAPLFDLEHEEEDRSEDCRVVSSAHRKEEGCVARVVAKRRSQSWFWFAAKIDSLSGSSWCENKENGFCWQQEKGARS
ncbi:hypothetical protein LWI29_003770 [Acer saccharum]|uniref:Uncharacterized protein n=1 Tax=Acer saccharum TaxID=4024 RepID=A0AA39T0I9_ACESA|nr:hypothetical protein LWI29_003770 [Acer saccharum]